MLDFRIKICGITSVTDALMVAETGADAIGLNFYSKSKRFQPDSNITQAIVAKVCDRVKLVGVFVNPSAQEVYECFERFGLHYIQLHGNETTEFANQLGLPVIKAIGIGIKHNDVQHEISRWRSLANVRAIMLDSASENTFGGTGKTFDWESAKSFVDHKLDIVLAGGLSPDNVEKAVNTVRPSAVDVASGVESAPGQKNAKKTRFFVENALRAFGATH